jgi:excisionase family DNA binding protein
MKTEKSIMDIHEVAKFLDLGIRTVYEMSRRGEIPCRKIAKQWRYNRDKIIAWVGQTGEIEEKPGDKSALKVLIVDDDESIIHLISDGLNSYLPNIRVQTAKDGLSALIAFGQFKPAVFILDIGIPKIDGLEVCRRLKNDPEVGPVYIISISGIEDPGLEEKARQAGVDLFLPKPLDITRLIKAVEKITR